ncbi:C4-dicarboxylate ABC transporter permease, partial [Lysinibacillus agricola]
MITLGAASKFFKGMLNPFTVKVAQSLAKVPLFSGIAFRAVVCLFFLSFSTFFVSHSFFQMKKDPKTNVLS